MGLRVRGLGLGLSHSSDRPSSLLLRALEMPRRREELGHRLTESASQSGALKQLENGSFYKVYDKSSIIAHRVRAFKN